MNNKQPVAYVICGFIGAGKTTFARKLEKETKAIRITKDEWIIKIIGNKITSFPIGDVIAAEKKINMDDYELAKILSI